MLNHVESGLGLKVSACRARQKEFVKLLGQLRQRSCEFLELLGSDWDSHRAGILDRMPVPEKEIGGAETRVVGDASIDEVPTKSTISKGKNDLLDLNDLLDAPSGQPAPVAQAPPPSSGGDLLDLLDAAPAANPPASQAAAEGFLDIFGGTPAAAQEVPPMVAFEKNGLKVTFFPKKEADGSVTVLARFANNLTVPMTNFVFEAAVPKYVSLAIQPATGQVLPPQTDLVTQTMSCVNSTNGEKGLLMKLRIGYVCNGTPVQEMGQVGGFPSGF